MGVAAIARDAVAPQRRIDLDDRRFARRHLPAIEWPEMSSISGSQSDKAQPRDSRVCRFGDGARHVKMKYRLRTSPYFCDPSPERITTAGHTVSALALSNEIDVGAVLICRPMPLKVVIGRPTSRGAGRTFRNIGAGTKSRGQCRPMSGVLLRSVRQASAQFLCVTSSYGGWARAVPRAALSLDLPCRRAGP